MIDLFNGWGGVLRVLVMGTPNTPSLDAVLERGLPGPGGPVPTGAGARGPAPADTASRGAGQRPSDGR